MLTQQNVFGLIGILSPETARVSQLSFPVVNKKIDRFVRYPVEEDRIIAGELKVGAKIPSGISISPPAGKCRFCHYLVARTCNVRRPCERSRNEAEHFFGSQRVYAAFLAAIKNSGANARTADEIPVQTIIRRLSGHLT